MQFWSDRGPQGYRCRASRSGARRLIDFEGITLPVKPIKQSNTAEKK